MYNMLYLFATWFVCLYNTSGCDIPMVDEEKYINLHNLKEREVREKKKKKKKLFQGSSKT